MRKTSAMAGVIAEAPEALSDQINVALFFGSVARGIETGEAMSMSCSSGRVSPRVKWGTDATDAGDRSGPIMEGMSCDNASATAVTRPLVTLEGNQLGHRIRLDE